MFRPLLTGGALGGTVSEQTYIILRSSSPITPEAGSLGSRSGPLGFDGGPQIVTLDQAELTPAERADLRRDPRTRALARPMPLALIAPVGPGADAAPTANSVTWGVQAVGATASSFNGDGITVALLDTGIDPNHAAFAGVELVRRNFTTEGSDDTNGHGTHCAGTLFGRDVEGMRIGVASGARRALVGKVLGAGGGSSATLAQAIQWAVDAGASVISMSLGIDFPGFVDLLVNEEGLEIAPATSIALEQYRANINLFNALVGAIDALGQFGNGAIVVAASGNESNRPAFEIAAGPPAAGTGVIAVGALQEGANGLSVASFSNTQVDVAGPGVGVISARPGGGLRSLDGTSMATPHVAGVAALWAQRQLAMTGRIEGATLMAQLVASGVRVPLDPATAEDDVGTGIAQAPA
jgi:subtilisin family serine protease